MSEFLQAKDKEHWTSGLPERHDPQYERKINLNEHVVGIPTEPVVALAVVAGYGQDGRRFENRTPTFGGIRIISSRTPAEAAIDTLLRPHSQVIEVGKYPGSEYDIVARARSADGWLRHNGQVLTVQDKVVYLRSVLAQAGLSRVMMHMQTPELVALATELGLDSRETLEAYQRTGSKTELNNALERFKLSRPEATIGPFGINFGSLQEMKREVERLRSSGVEACIKFDSFEAGKNLTGGIGQFNTKRGEFLSDILRHIETYLGEQGVGSNIAGVVQMRAEVNRVYSISSGELGDGYKIYETHIQTQDGAASDGAKPVGKNAYGDALLNEVWPQVQELYAQEGVTGDQNLNLLVLPPQQLAVARKLYGQANMSPIVPIDLNPRPLSGTKTAMGRYVEETGVAVNQDNFFTRGVKVHPVYGANPHLIYAYASEHGYNAGVGGNFAMTNMGKFVPERLAETDSTSCQLFLQDTPNPEEELAGLEAKFVAPPSDGLVDVFRERGYDVVSPQQAASMDEDEYTDLLTYNMRVAVMR